MAPEQSWTPAWRWLQPECPGVRAALGVSASSPSDEAIALPRTMGSWAVGSSSGQGASCRQPLDLFSHSLHPKKAAGQSSSRPRRAGGRADGSSPAVLHHPCHTQRGGGRTLALGGQPSLLAQQGLVQPGQWAAGAGGRQQAGRPPHYSQNQASTGPKMNNLHPERSSPRHWASLRTGMQALGHL